MAYDKIKALTDLTAAPVTLVRQLGTPQQQRRLRGVFLGRKLVQPESCPSFTSSSAPGLPLCETLRETTRMAVSTTLCQEGHPIWMAARSPTPGNGVMVLTVQDITQNETR